MDGAMDPYVPLTVLQVDAEATGVPPMRHAPGASEMYEVVLKLSRPASEAEAKAIATAWGQVSDLGAGGGGVVGLRVDGLRLTLTNTTIEKVVERHRYILTAVAAGDAVGKQAFEERLLARDFAESHREKVRRLAESVDW